MGMCMEEHTCEAKLPHINGKVVKKEEIWLAKGLVPEHVVVHVVVIWGRELITEAGHDVENACSPLLY